MNTNDRELLELAAKAAGYKFSDYTFEGEDGICLVNPTKHNWNPLEDNEDAFRLLVMLKLVISFTKGGNNRSYEGVAVEKYIDGVGPYAWEHEGVDILAATRRAIVRTAAKIGKEMQ